MRSRPWLPRIGRCSGLNVRSRALLRFGRCREGATAVEFALVGLPFVFLMFAILELAMVFWTTQVLETAVANAARQIYTGQFQTDSSNANKSSSELAAKFKEALCANVTALFDCSKVSIDIRNFSYSGSTAPSPVKNGAFDPSDFKYETIGADQIALVTAAMEYKTTVKMLAGSTGLANGNRLIMATTTFRTEPFSN